MFSMRRFIRARYDGQQVVEVVRDLAHHQAERLQFLGARQLDPGLSQLVREYRVPGRQGGHRSEVPGLAQVVLAEGPRAGAPPGEDEGEVPAFAGQGNEKSGRDIPGSGRAGQPGRSGRFRREAVLVLFLQQRPRRFAESEGRLFPVPQVIVPRGRPGRRRHRQQDLVRREEARGRRQYGPRGPLAPGPGHSGPRDLVQPPLLHGPLRGGFQRVYLERLLEVIGGAQPHALHGGLYGAVGGQHYDRRTRAVPAELAKSGQSVHAGHHEVEEYEVEIAGPRQGDALLA
jgi:hypothetical protein